MKLINKIGFMQGRLSPMIRNKLQAFPFAYWQKEFKIANSLNIKLMEWTIDNFKFEKNPIIKNRVLIKKLSINNNLLIPSITLDFFMESPIWKLNKKDGLFLEKKLLTVLESCKSLGIPNIIIPILDNSSIKNEKEKNKFIEFAIKFKNFLIKNKLRILIESDLDPISKLRFIKKFPNNIFGINYDTGNSAFMGYDINDEMKYYKEFIFNIHIKDRKFKGPSVMLGEGHYDFKLLFKKIVKIYKGNYILQSARYKKNYVKDLKNNYNFLIDNIKNYY
jgi:hexulose-6-phosphate isomerase